MTNVYLERIGEAKRLYAELVDQPKNEEIRAAFHSVNEAIYQYFEDLAQKITEADKRDALKDALEFKDFFAGIDYEIVNGDTYQTAPVLGFWPPRKFL